MNRKRVLVTGASQFVGLNVVEALGAAGHETRAYDGAASNLTYLASLPAQLHTGDLGDRARLGEAMKGVDAVIHCAANASFQEDGGRTDVEGTRAVVDAAVDAGVRRFVYTSTTAAIGALDDPARQWNEDSPLVGFRAESPHARTAAAAESIVRAAILRGLDVVVLNPAEVMGAWDYQTHWGRMVLAVASARLPFIPSGTGSFCSSREVGRAHVSALTRGSSGARYILAGTDTTYCDLVQTIARVVGVTPPVPESGYVEKAPGMRAMMADGVRRETGPGEPPLRDPYRARLYAGHYRFDSSRAVRDLGYRVVPLVDIVREAYDWYRASGFIPARVVGAGGALTSRS